jgi:dsDNA-binding SOS-regulon protein
MPNKSRTKEMVDRDSTMAKLITWFDAYAALSIVNPARIEKLIKGQSGSDLDSMWKNVKKDVTTIVEMPSESEQVQKAIRLSSNARGASLILTMISFGVLIFFFLSQNAFKGFGNLALVSGVAIAVMYASLMVSFFATRRMNNTVRKFYDKHESDLYKNRAKMKETAQTLIDKLQRDVVSHDLDPDRFRFEVFHNDYRGISVLKERGQKYLATVRSKKSAHKD